MTTTQTEKPILMAGVGSRRRVWAWPVCGAFLGLAGSGLAGVIGATCAGIALFSDKPWLQTSGTVFLVLMIPLLMCGAHCLDLVDQQLHSNGLPNGRRKKTARELRLGGGFLRNARAVPCKLSWIQMRGGRTN